MSKQKVTYTVGEKTGLTTIIDLKNPNNGGPLLSYLIENHNKALRWSEANYYNIEVTDSVVIS